MKIEDKKWIKGRGGYAKKVLISNIKEKIVHIQLNKFPPRAHIPPHKHKRTKEIFYVINGQALLRIGKKVYRLRPEMIVVNPPGKVHELKNSGKKELQLLTLKINPDKNDTYWLK